MRLLVSVRSAAEAIAAIEGGAAIIDVKEPLRGSLGAADPDTLRQVARAVGRRVPLSAALGELSKLPAADGRRDETMRALKGYGFAKAGLSEAGSDPRWQVRWQEFARHLPRGVLPVAVAYADWQCCGAPPPAVVFAQARRLGFRVLLLDTFDKRDGNVLVHMPPAAIADLFAAAQTAAITTVLAGSLRLSDLSAVQSIPADFLAVRGAACDTGRTGHVQRQLVAQLAAALRWPVSSSGGSGPG